MRCSEISPILVDKAVKALSTPFIENLPDVLWQGSRVITELKSLSEIAISNAYWEILNAIKEEICKKYINEGYKKNDKRSKNIFLSGINSDIESPCFQSPEGDLIYPMEEIMGAHGMYFRSEKTKQMLAEISRDWKNQNTTDCTQRENVRTCLLSTKHGERSEGLKSDRRETIKPSAKQGIDRAIVAQSNIVVSEPTWSNAVTVEI